MQSAIYTLTNAMRLLGMFRHRRAIVASSLLANGKNFFLTASAFINASIYAANKKYGSLRGRETEEAQDFFIEMAGKLLSAFLGKSVSNADQVENFFVSLYAMFGDYEDPNNDWALAEIMRKVQNTRNISTGFSIDQYYQKFIPEKRFDERKEACLQAIINREKQPDKEDLIEDELLFVLMYVPLYLGSNGYIMNAEKKRVMEVVNSLYNDWFLYSGEALMVYGLLAFAIADDTPEEENVRSEVANTIKISFAEKHGKPSFYDDDEQWLRLLKNLVILLGKDKIYHEHPDVAPGTYYLLT